MRQQLIREGKEPIYQNLPIHERMMIDTSGQDQEEEENEDLNTTNYEKDIADDDIEEARQVIFGFVVKVESSREKLFENL